uniref:Uncharacterized protein n=1 Tax=Anguilla anguilla TaxID=7936 RepID=A0A0E9V8U7_ANGAN
MLFCGLDLGTSAVLPNVFIGLEIYLENKFHGHARRSST